MIKWIQYLLSSAPTLTLPQIGPSFDRQALPARQSSRYISDTTIQWLDGFREKYDVPGFGIGIISSPARTEHGWQSEILSFGHSDNHCKAYKEEVSVQTAVSLRLSADRVDHVPHWRQFQALRLDVHRSARQQQHLAPQW